MDKTGNSTNKTAGAVALTGILGLALAGIFLLWLNLPWAANHFNFALPGQDGGLPYRVSYNGRTYITTGICAGADWCKNQKPACVSAENLSDSNQWPLKQVGEVPTLFGAAHSIFIPTSKVGMSSTVVFVSYSENCFLAYGIEGSL